jgi:acyl-CoA synthetase (AMP-forming)/AMP-acid ligase II
VSASAALPAVERQPARLNVADHLHRLADTQPRQSAAILPGARDANGRRSYRQLSFYDLDRMIDRHARGLIALGVGPGMRVLLFVRPSFDFFALTFALFRIGATIVMIDPGMKRDHVLGAIRESEPDALIAVPRAHLARALFPSAFRSTRIRVVTGRHRMLGAASLREVEALGAADAPFPGADTRPEDAAAILFTSGSTGAPKGAIYTHAIFEQQVRIFKEELSIRPGEIDLSAFPLFSLFSLALGVTCVVPDMDATRPGSVDPRLIVESIRDLGVTYCFGSPAFWNRVADHCHRHGIVLDTVRRILMAGAPAPVSLLESLVGIVPEKSEVYTPYGATECLPITMPSARSILDGPARKTAEGAGTFVGKPLGRTEVRIIRIADQPIPDFMRAEVLGPGAIGEITVSGPVTTRGYFRRPDDDVRSKIEDGDLIWHRMGDVGYLDELGRLWFCGRKAHRVETGDGPMFTEPVEAIFNRHPRVSRSALIGTGERGGQKPVIIIEPKKGSEPRGRADERGFKEELLDLARSSPLTASIRDVLFHPSFPVDPRHNAKIIREELAIWAASKV